MQDNGDLKHKIQHAGQSAVGTDWSLAAQNWNTLVIGPAPGVRAQRVINVFRRNQRPENNIVQVFI